MSSFVDLIYFIGLVIASPILVPRLIIRGKRGYDWRARLGHVEAIPPGSSPRILIHAVSVGEANAIETLVTQLLEQPDPHDVVIAVTTETGFSRATTLYGERCKVVRYPLDFSRSVGRFLDAIRPDLLELHGPDPTGGPLRNLSLLWPWERQLLGPRRGSASGAELTGARSLGPQITRHHPRDRPPLPA